MLTEKSRSLMQFKCMLFADDERFRRFRLRSLLTAGIIGAGLTFQTALVYHPFYLIQALTHGRAVGLQEFVRTTDERQAIYLRLLFDNYIRYHRGDDPTFETLDPNLPRYRVAPAE